MFLKTMFKLAAAVYEKKFYSKLLQALEQARQNGTIETFLQDGNKLKELLLDIGLNENQALRASEQTTILGTVVSQQRSEGESLLKLVVETVPEKKLSHLLGKEEMSDFMEREHTFS